MKAVLVFMTYTCSLLLTFSEIFLPSNCGSENSTILDSIDKNLHVLETCRSTIHYSLSKNSSTNILPPNSRRNCAKSSTSDCFNVVCYNAQNLDDEIRIFRDPSKVPHTLTLSTPGPDSTSFFDCSFQLNNYSIILELGVGLVGGKRLAKSWSQETKKRWAIPDDHLAQNRAFCYKESLKASQKITSLYKPYREQSSVVNGYYVSIFRNGLIHQSGQVGTHCTMFQGVEGCETRFNITGVWWRNCHSLLNSLGLNWNIFWFGNNGRGNSSARFQDKFHSPFDHSQVTEMKEILRVCLYSSDSGRAQYLPPLQFPKYYDRVFVINGFFDSNYHHFLIDSLSRLSRHVDFLVAHPHIKIHIRSTEFSMAGVMRENKKRSEQEIRSVMLEAQKMRNKIFRVLGISGERVIFGTVLAGEVFLPRLSRCYFCLANPLELRLLAKKLLEGSMRRLSLSKKRNLDEDSFDRIADNPASKLDYAIVDNSRDFYSFSGDELVRKYLVLHSGVGYRPNEPAPPAVDLSKPRLLVLQRHTLLYRAGNWRDWHDDIFNAICSALAAEFVNHTVVAIRSNDKNFEKCIECLIWQFSHADIIVGAHGAGLTNMIFMKPGGVVVETVGIWDGRMLPVCGYTGVLCASIGHHHFIYYYDWENRKRLLTNPHLNVLQPSKLARESFNFYSQVRAISSITK